MREAFHGELAQLGSELAAMCGLAAYAMECATHALIDNDLTLAEQVIAGDAEIDALRAHCEDHACALPALQAPVARDLRLLVSGIQAAEKIERMGDLAQHVADVVRLRHPEPAIPVEMTDQFAEMGRLAVQAAREIQRVIVDPLEVHFPERDHADDRTDQLYHHLLTAASRKDSPYPARTGVDVALLARFFERFCDQAVSVSRRLDYVVTGEIPR